MCVTDAMLGAQTARGAARRVGPAARTPSAAAGRSAAAVFMLPLAALGDAAPGPASSAEHRLDTECAIYPLARGATWISAAPASGHTMHMRDGRREHA